MHRPWSVVYKVDQFVLETLLSSFVLLNTKVIFCFYMRFQVITGSAWKGQDFSSIASDQYYVGKPKSINIEYVVSRMVCILYFVVLFCW